MFIEEALHINKFIRNNNIRSKSILNVGSGDKRFRAFIQPYIQEHIVDELERRECKIFHLDKYGGDGVDIRMDISDLASLKQTYDIVLCSNVFEHFADRTTLASQLVKLTKKGGYIIVTTPYVFPYHEDPVDTLFRPTPEEQLALFSYTMVIEKLILPIRNPYYSRGILLPLWIMKLLMFGKSIMYKIKGAPIDLISDWKIVLSGWKTTYVVVQI